MVSFRENYLAQAGLDQMKFLFAGSQDETTIKQFLEANDLIHQDSGGFFF